MFNLFGIGGRDVKDLKDPSYKKVSKVRKDIRVGIRERPDQRHLVIYVLACHGMQADGRQNAVVNSHNKRTSFYQLWNTEHDVRDSARLFKNGYFVALAACCREIFNATKHRG